MPCIYKIKNKVNERVYVGKAIDVKDRFIRHKSMLKCGKHFNDHLQRSYNKHGKDNFEYSVLEECRINDLSVREQHWINCNKDNLYNSKLYVEDQAGYRNSFYGKKHSDESKKKMSLKKKGIFDGEKNPNFGKKASLETKLKMAKNNSGNKLTQKKVLEIVQLLKKGMSHQKIADVFQIGRTVITRISNGTRWANVTGGPIVPIVYKDGIRQFSELHRQRIGNKRKGQKHAEKTKQLIREKALSRGRK